MHRSHRRKSRMRRRRARRRRSTRRGRRPLRERRTERGGACDARVYTVHAGIPSEGLVCVDRGPVSRDGRRMTDTTDLDATAMAELVRTKKVSPLELVDAAIARIEALDPKLNAV